MQGDGNKPLVALKELQPDKERYYQREADTLNVIRELNNRHLIKPIATYRRGDSLCFMFPWAHGGNLREFWAGQDKIYAPRLSRDKDLVLWSLEQMCGLTQGLEALHGKNCRHGDLKPENLLRFTEGGGRGILLIADVGLAKFHMEVTKNRHARTQTMTGTFRYEPPECDDKSDNPRSRAYDVWSLGCIYLEFLIWLVDGQEGLDEFNQPGNFQHFWDSKDGRYQLHDVVHKKINALGKRLKFEDPGTETALKDLLRVIVSRALEIRLKRNEDSVGIGRATAGELSQALSAIYLRAKIDQSYLFDGSIWRRKANALPTPLTLEVPRRTDQPAIPIISLSTASPVAEENKSIIISLDESPKLSATKLAPSSVAAQEVCST